MKQREIKVGKTYHNREHGRAQREVLAIEPYTENLAGIVHGQRVKADELVVRYKTNARQPKIAYAWLNLFAHWAGSEVGAQPVSSASVLHLTDDVRQDASTPDGAVAYLVFTPDDQEHDYKIFTDQSEAVSVALDTVVAAGSDEAWRVYPLYAGAPITE